MSSPRILLVGGPPLVATMLTEHLHHDGQYQVESVAYCDHALAMLQRRPFDLLLVLSVYVPWAMWPSAYSRGWHADIMTALVAVFPRLIAYPFAALAVWIAGALIYRCVRLRRAAQRDTRPAAG
jgi:hypothetical protein